MRRVAIIGPTGEGAAHIVTGPDSREEPSIPDRVIWSARQSFPGPDVRSVSARFLSGGEPPDPNRFSHMDEIPSVGSRARMSTASAVPGGPQTTLKQSYIP